MVARNAAGVAGNCADRHGAAQVGRAGLVFLMATWLLACANLSGSMAKFAFMFEDVVDAAMKHEAEGGSGDANIAVFRAEKVREAMRHAWGGYYKVCCVVLRVWAQQRRGLSLVAVMAGAAGGAALRCHVGAEWPPAISLLPVQYAFGADELMPTSKQPKSDILGGVGVKGMGVTIIDALSTLKVMGLDQEFQR